MKQQEIELLLPEVFRRAIAPGTALDALVKTMEMMHEPAEQVLSRIDVYFDPYRAPEHVLRYLAGWVGLDWLFAGFPPPRDRAEPPSFPSGLGALRGLIATASELAAWRGTKKGLVAFLETATGVPGFTVDESPPDGDGRPRPFHLVVHVPAAAAALRELIDVIVRHQKPAYATCELALPGD